MNREVAIRKLDQQAKLLKSVEAALARIDDGTYGVCLRCEEEIPEKRLKAVPWAGHCVAGQDELDRQHTTGDLEEDNHSTELAA